MTDVTLASQAISFDSTLCELPTDEGAIRHHESGDGQPLVLLHGSGPGVSRWRSLRGNLSDFAQHFRVLVLEFPGSGASDPTGEHPMLAAPDSVLRHDGADGDD